MYRIACLTALAAVLLAATTARASDPIGGYAIVDRVALDSNDAPTTIQIWGSFSLATSRGGNSYSNPERGYLFYKVPAGKETVCRKEWNDLKKAAGAGQVIGFGSSYELNALGKVRKANEKPEAPDVYPVANGLVKVPENAGYGPILNLRALPAPVTPGDGDLVPPGEITLVVRNILDKTHPKARYVFELEGGGVKEETTVPAGEKETKWTPKTPLKAGEKYTWKVRAAEGSWKGPEVTSAIVVKGSSKD
jgi:hypothetical protein